MARTKQSQRSETSKIPKKQRLILKRDQPIYQKIKLPKEYESSDDDSSIEKEE